MFLSLSAENIPNQYAVFEFQSKLVSSLQGIYEHTVLTVIENAHNLSLDRKEACDDKMSQYHEAIKPKQEGLDEFFRNTSSFERR